MHANGERPSRRERGALGATGEAGAGKSAVGRFPEADWGEKACLTQEGANGDAQPVVAPDAQTATLRLPFVRR